MTAALAHRGPDADGFHHDGPIGFGHRRLSVIDLAGSRQPLLSADREIAVVFNGEIYNFRELRQELAAAGHAFVTNGDGEVLVHGWRQWGRALLGRLSGMFAFALWDRVRRELFLARDHLGVKPLYYAWHGGALVFGSEIKALLPFPGLPRTLDLDALALFLECQYIPAPHSIYAAIRKLPAGYWLSVHDGKFTTAAFWRPAYVPKHALDSATAVEAIDAQLRRSVGSMLVADVPLGAFVSGGVDSGLIAALAANTRRQSVWRGTSEASITASCCRPTTCCLPSTAGSMSSTNHSATRLLCRPCCLRSTLAETLLSFSPAKAPTKCSAATAITSSACARNGLRAYSAGAGHRCHGSRGGCPDASPATAS
jgi:asparagine synthase (glutamine-hydrolysing)